jgi:hypothetical protein
MSDTESFIEEVTEEVRRDKLFLALRKYGWIGVVGVAALVGGAAFNEYTTAKNRAAAEAAGDAILAVLQTEDADARLTALTDIEVTDKNAALLGLLTSTEAQTAGDIDAAKAALDTVITADVDQIYRDIAGFKKALLETDATAKRAAFDTLLAPGNALRLLAEEQVALLEAQAGDADAAISRLNAVLEDAESTATLRSRVGQLIVALGGTPVEVNGAFTQ